MTPVRIVFCLWISLFANTFLAFEIGSLSKYYINDKVRRVVDLRDSIVRENIIIKANNTRNMAMSDYYMAIPQTISSKLSSFQAHLKNEPDNLLQIQNLGLDRVTNSLVFKITFKEPIQPQSKVVIEAKIIYIHLLEPLPRKIPQLSRQHVALQSYIFFYSPYPTNEVKSTFRLPSTSPVNIDGGNPDFPGVQSGDLITYGPFHDINPYSSIVCRIHYEYRSAILTLIQLKRELEVSHWGGNIAFEEQFALRHDGAQLDKEFSRIDFQASPYALEQTNVLTKLELTLPQSATDVYYRDEVGNVSTSHYKKEQSRSVLEIQPRFPLFGGWKTTWYIGYNVPISQYVRHIKEENVFVLKANFVENLNSIAANQVDFKVVLPEGAELVDIETPKLVEMDSIEKCTHYTFFDSTGRLAITFTRRNVVMDHELPIFIKYKYSTLNLLQKPFVTSGALLAIYIFCILLGKLPYTIGEKGELSLKVYPASKLSLPIENEPVSANTRGKKPVSPIVLVEQNSTTTFRKKKSRNRGK